MDTSVRIFNDVEEGIVELRRLLDAASGEERDSIMELIHRLEFREIEGAIYFSMNGDGAISPLVIGGTEEQQLKMANQLREYIRNFQARTYH